MRENDIKVHLILSVFVSSGEWHCLGWWGHHLVSIQHMTRAEYKMSSVRKVLQKGTMRWLPEKRFSKRIRNVSCNQLLFSSNQIAFYLLWRKKLLKIEISIVISCQLLTEYKTHRCKTDTQTSWSTNAHTIKCKSTDSNKHISETFADTHWMKEQVNSQSSLHMTHIHRDALRHEEPHIKCPYFHRNTSISKHLHWQKQDCTQHLHIY